MWSAEALNSAAIATQVKTEPIIQPIEPVSSATSVSDINIILQSMPNVHHGWSSSNSQLSNAQTASPMHHLYQSQRSQFLSGVDDISMKMSSYHNVHQQNLTMAAAAAAAAASGMPNFIKQDPDMHCSPPQPQQPQSTIDHQLIESSEEVMERLAQYDLRNDSRIIETVRSFVTEQLAPSLHDLSKLFHNLCWFLEQALFTLVDWARHGEYFRTISVEDQMQLLNSSWSEVLLMEYIYHMMHTFRNENLMRQNSNFTSSTDLLNLLGQTELRGRLVELMDRLEALQLSPEEFSAIKFLLLFNPGKHDVSIQKSQDFIETVQFRVSNALLDYTVTRSAHIPDKYGQILLRLPEIKFIAFKLEALLLEKFKAEVIPRNTLIAEMLISKSARVGNTI